MASQDEQKFDNLQRQLKGLNKDTSTFQAAFDAANKSGKGMSDLLDAMEGQINKLTKGASNFNDELRDSLDLARAIADSMEKQHGGIQRAKRAMNGIISIGQQIIDEERELDALSERRLQQLNKEARIKLKNFQIEALNLAGSMSIQEKLAANRKEKRELEAAELQNQTKQGQLRLKQLFDENEIIGAYKNQEHSYEKIVRLTRERFKLEKEVTKTFGLTGVALSAASSVASKMGMGHISNQLDDIDNKLRNEIRQAIDLNDNKALGFGKRFQFAAKGAMLTGKAIGKGMLDPLYLMGKIYSAFLDVNKESVELSRLSGQNGDAMAGANFALADTVDVLKVAGELTKQMGLNAQNVFSPNVMAGAAELKNTMGLSAEEAGGLAVMAQTGGKDIKGMSTSMVSVVSSFNKSNKSAVSQGVALRDAASASDSMKLSLGNSGTALVKAAASAARLGLTLKDLDSISDSLVDFQSSISNELEAELLIGKDLNLEKARELALSNDIAGVGNEIFKNSSSIAEFGKMNRIQQDAYAKALGLTKDQLAKIAYNKALALNMSEEEAAKAAGVEASDMRRMAVQEKMAKVMDKIFQAFSPILDVIELIVDAIAPLLQIVGGVVGFLAKILSNVYILYPAVLLLTAAFAGKAVASFFGTAIKGTRDLLASTKELLSGGLGQKLKTFGSSLGDAYSKARNGGAGDMVKSKSGKLYSKDSPQGKMITNLSGKTDKAGDLAQSAKGKPGGGMMESFSKINTTALIKAAAAMAIAAVGIFIFAKAIQELEKVKDWQNVAIGLGAFAVSMGVLAAVGNLAGPGLTALGAALNAFGAAMMTGYGAVGLAALTVAAIGLGYALNLAAPGIEAFGTVITSVFAGIATLIPVIVDGFVTLISSLAGSIGPMLLLGPALFGIAAGLGAVALAGILSLPAIGGLVALSLAAPALVSLGIGGGESKSAGEAKGKADEGSLSAVAAKLDTLIGIAKQGTKVYIDGKVVASANIKNTNLVKSNTQ